MNIHGMSKEHLRDYLKRMSISEKVRFLDESFDSDFISTLDSNFREELMKIELDNVFRKIEYLRVKYGM